MSRSIPDLYEREKQSIPQIASITGLPRSRVRKKLLDAGVQMRSRAEGVRLSRDRIAEGNRGKRRPKSAAHRRRISEGRRKWAEENARGVSVKPNGYVEYTRGEHKGRSVHVIAMEQRLGRPLRADEVVHHVDGDRSNNDINNLALMTRSAHGRLHRREDELAGIERDRRQDGTFA